MKTIGEVLVELLSKPIQLEFDFVDEIAPRPFHSGGREAQTKEE